jgi:hypothetical protein
MMWNWSLNYSIEVEFDCRSQITNLKTSIESFIIVAAIPLLRFKNKLNVKPCQAVYVFLVFQLVLNKDCYQSGAATIADVALVAFFSIVNYVMKI